MIKSYTEFIQSKTRVLNNTGFDFSVENALFDFQREIVGKATKKGRYAIFADCGLGKTPMQLYWAEAVANHTGGRVIILTPLAVAEQTAREAKKFGIDAKVSKDGIPHRITITNYEKLHKFDCSDFVGVDCDESSILKNYAGSTRNAITDFMRDAPYRLLCSATPSPNDFMELGTSSEALGVMRRVEMLSEYFTHDSGKTQSWVLKGHARGHFWEWVSQWATALRKPSDIGFDDGKFILPELRVRGVVLPSKALAGRLFAFAATTLQDQRAERRETITDRCDAVAEIANSESSPFVAWCSLNDESKMLTEKINGAVEISGADSDDEKERKLLGFADGTIKTIVTKPQIAGFGLNWQHCNRMSFFPSHSHEQYYQAVRRCWRFGQTRPVDVHIVTTEAESMVVENMRRKEIQSIDLYDQIIKNMNPRYSKTKYSYNPEKQMEIPKWLAV